MYTWRAFLSMNALGALVSLSICMMLVLVVCIYTNKISLVKKVFLSIVITSSILGLVSIILNVWAFMQNN